MNNLNINNLKRFKDYLVIENEKSKVVFSTAEENRSFNRHTDDGVENLMSIKKDFNVNVSNEDTILTLSTCANNNKYRVVLHSVRVK